MKKYLLIIITLISCTQTKNMMSDISNNQDLKFVVDIDKFYLSPPPCGFENTLSLYSAHIKGYKKSIFRDPILIAIQCKSDIYPSSISNNVEITVRNCYQIFDKKSIYNFSNIPNDSIIFHKVYKVIDINPLTTTLPHEPFAW